MFCEGGSGPTMSMCTCLKRPSGAWTPDVATNFGFLTQDATSSPLFVSLLIAVHIKRDVINFCVARMPGCARLCSAKKKTCRRCLAGTYGRSCPVEVSHQMSPTEEANGICWKVRLWDFCRVASSLSPSWLAAIC